jgi:glycine cleavage system aminomethyltransferase T
VSPQPQQVTKIGHAEVPWVYTDLDTEYRALRTGAGVVDLDSAGLIELPADEARRLLRTTVTRDLESLYPGNSGRALRLDQQGHPVDLVTVHRSRDRWLLETAFGRGAGTLTALTEQAEHVEPVDVREELGLLGIEGPDAPAVLGELVGPAATGVPLGSVARTTWDGEPVVVSRTGFTGERGYRLLVPRARHPEIFAAAAELARPVGFQALEVAMLEVRFPVLHREVGPDDTALVCGYHWLVDHDRPGFTGRDAVLAEHGAGPAAVTVGVAFPAGARLAERAELSMAGVPVGRLVHHVQSPGLACTLALARVAPEWAASGIECVAAGDPEPVTGRTASAPYLLPRSWLPVTDPTD